jgi:hypothetical protein
MLKEARRRRRKPRELVVRCSPSVAARRSPSEGIFSRMSTTSSQPTRLGLGSGVEKFEKAGEVVSS